MFPICRIYVKSADCLCQHFKMLTVYVHTKCGVKYNELGRSDPKLRHCYRNLFPWKNIGEFSEYLASSVVYNKDGLVVLNKPFGIKVHGHDKPGARSKAGQNRASPLPVCDFTVEDALPHLKNYLKVSNLSILKSAEKYTSGIMLLSADQKISEDVKRSFNIAKNRKLPHLIHWMLTLGYPVATYKKERVGIKILDAGEGEIRQPVIVNNVSRRAVMLKKIHPVLVEFRVLSTNPALPTSLVEIATSSVKFHFVRVYASDRIATILGDVLYSSRMNTLLGVPVKAQLQKSLSFDMQPLPEKIAEKLDVPKGADGHSMIPTMLHLRSIILPSFRGEDLTLTAELPVHFTWTKDKLNLLSECK